MDYTYSHGVCCQCYMLGDIFSASDLKYTHNPGITMSKGWGTTVGEIAFALHRISLIEWEGKGRESVNMGLPMDLVSSRCALLLPNACDIEGW